MPDWLHSNGAFYVTHFRCDIIRMADRMLVTGFQYNHNLASLSTSIALRRTVVATLLHYFIKTCVWKIGVCHPVIRLNLT